MHIMYPFTNSINLSCCSMFHVILTFHSPAYHLGFYNAVKPYIVSRG